MGTIRIKKDIDKALEFCDIIAIGTPIISDENYMKRILNNEIQNAEKYPSMGDFENLFDFV